MKPFLPLLILAPTALSQSQLQNSGELDAGASLLQNAAFGSALDAEGDWVVVGATQSVLNLPGEVQLFERVGGSIFTSVSTAGGAAAGDAFGSAVSVDVDGGTPVVLVGSPQNDQDLPNAGRASLFELVGGALQLLTELAPGDPQASSGFGSAVATDAGTHAVGRPGAGAGNVYLFDGSGSGIVSLPQVSPFDGGNGDLFGSSIALEGGFLAVGAPLGDATGVDSGAVYLFEQQVEGAPFQALFPLTNAKIVGAEVVPGDQFGRSLALAGDLLVVGAPFDGPGAAYVFRRGPGGGFVQLQRLSVPGLAANAQFGTSVDIDGTRILVGAPLAASGATQSGLAFVFEEASPDQWSPVWAGELVGALANSFVGSSVAVAGDLAFAGASGATADGAAGAGRVGVFDVSAGVCLLDLLGSTSQGRADEFGRAVAWDGALAAVGAPFDDDGASNSGSIALLERQGVTWDSIGVLRASTPVTNARLGTSIGLEGDLLAAGAPGAPGASFVSGRVSLWERSGFGAEFIELQTLQASDAQPGDEFGQGLDIEQGSLLVGSPGVAQGVGGVRTFGQPSPGADFEALQDFSVFLPGAIGDRAGESIAAEGDIAVIGLPGAGGTGAGGAGAGTGRVLALERESFVPLRWSSTDGSSPSILGAWDLGDNIGGSDLCLIDDIDDNGVQDLLVSADRDDDGAQDAGAVYLLRLDLDGSVLGATKWGEAQLGIALDEADLFGRSMCVAQLDLDPQMEVVIGAIGDDDAGNSAGAVYIIDVDSSWIPVGTTKINAATGGGASGTQFGSALENLGDLDLDGIDEIAVGMSDDLIGGNNFGSVRVLFFDSSKTVVQATSFHANNLGFSSTSGDDFGREMALAPDLDGDGRPQLLVGDPEFQIGGLRRGALYVLDVEADGTLTFLSRITQGQSGFSEQIDSYDYFARGVGSPGDLDGDGVIDLVASASGNDDVVLGSGTLYVLFMNADGTVREYRRWTSGNTPLGTEQLFNAGFGVQVEVMGDADGDGFQEFAVLAQRVDDSLLYIIDVGPGWVLEQDLLDALSPEAGARFGSSVATDGETVLVGSPGASIDGALSGSVSVFERVAGELQETGVLVPSLGASGAGFGSAVSIDGDRAFVSAPGGLDGLPALGRVFTFERLGAGQPFIEVDLIEAPEGEPGDVFGGALALEGTTLLVGAPAWDLANTDEGTVYAYSLSGADCPVAVATADFLSVTNGGPQTIFVEPGSAFAGQLFVTLASLAPGFVPLAPGVILPLAFDAFLNLSLSQGNQGPFVNTFGLLDADGLAQSQILLPSGLPSSLAGVTLHAAYVVAEFPNLVPVFASDALVVELIP